MACAYWKNDYISTRAPALGSASGGGEMGRVNLAGQDSGAIWNAAALSGGHGSAPPGHLIYYSRRTPSRGREPPVACVANVSAHQGQHASDDAEQVADGVREGATTATWPPALVETRQEAQVLCVDLVKLGQLWWCVSRKSFSSWIGAIHLAMTSA